jgi:hypothetical protein
MVERSIQEYERTNYAPSPPPLLSSLSAVICTESKTTMVESNRAKTNWEFNGIH